MKGYKLLKKFERNREKVREIFNREDVVVSYIFGSASQGKVGPLSDMDFAVYLDGNLSKKRMDFVHMNILNDLITVLGDDIDLVLMNGSEILLNFNIIKTGKVLYQRSGKERVALESKIIDKNADIKHYRKRHVNKMIHRFAEKGLA